MTRSVSVGGLQIGGGSPVSVQSMTNTDTADFAATLQQIERLAAAGCALVRLAVRGEDDLPACRRLVKEASVPLAADIQYDYRLAVACSDMGFAKVRFNPGNIGGDAAVRTLVAACKANGTLVRVGVNLGSLERDIEERYGRTAEALVESALRQAALLERFGFYDTVLSVKASDVQVMTRAYRLLAARTDYPLHVGVTESGTFARGIVKSAVGIGSLLLDGIGDTIRVSLTGDPVREVAAGLRILEATGLRRDFVEIISCPTCARTAFDLEAVVTALEEVVAPVKKRLKIAVMGCAVNGPGEAKDADFGVAGGKDRAVIFQKGAIVGTVRMEEIVPVLKRMIEDFDDDQTTAKTE